MGKGEAKRKDPYLFKREGKHVSSHARLRCFQVCLLHVGLLKKIQEGAINLHRKLSGVFVTHRGL